MNRRTDVWPSSAVSLPQCHASKLYRWFRNNRHILHPWAYNIVINNVYTYIGTGGRREGGRGYKSARWMEIIIKKKIIKVIIIKNLRRKSLLLTPLICSLLALISPGHYVFLRAHSHTLTHTTHTQIYTGTAHTGNLRTPLRHRSHCASKWSHCCS